MNLKSIVTPLALVLMFSTAAGAHADDTEHNLRAVSGHIVPRYQTLADETASLAATATVFCANPDQPGLEKVRAGFQRGTDAWQSIQHIRFGPIEFLLRMNRFQLWPDKRGNVAKHLQQLLAQQDRAALAPQRFADGSVAVQGFSALEMLLFDDGATADAFSANTPDGAYRCAVLLAITANLSDMSAGLVHDWTQGDNAYSGFIRSAAQGNAFYSSERDVSSLLLNNLYTGMLMIVDQKLDLPLDKSLQSARGTRAENWRSGRSLRNIQSNLEGLHDFYRGAFAPRLPDAKLHQAIEAAFADTLQALAAVPAPLHSAVQDPTARPAVEKLRREAARLKNLIGGELPAALDLPLGFNSLDGD